MARPAISDNHVHTEWSWDAPNGSMEDSCRRAVEFGIPALAFTEHTDRLISCLSRLPSITANCLGLRSPRGSTLKEIIQRNSQIRVLEVKSRFEKPCWHAPPPG